jgi:hypothetical protein
MKTEKFQLSGNNSVCAGSISVTARPRSLRGHIGVYGSPFKPRAGPDPVPKMQCC